MTFPTFDALSDHLIGLFRSQQFAEALETVTREGPRFPDNRPWADYWHMCAAARVGDRAQLQRVAERAHADGLWYGEVMWRQTPSFAPLQGDEAFEKLVAESLALAARESPQNEPVLRLHLPANHSAASPLLLALHGNQANADNTLPFWQPAVVLGWALAVGQSGDAMFSGAYVWDNLDRLAQTVPHDPGRVVLAGHSMGGLVAIRMALQGEARVKGFVVNGPATPFVDAPDELEALLAPARARGLRGYLIVGANDADINNDDLHQLATKLRMAGLACKLEVVPGAHHGYTPAYDAALRRALAFVDGA